MLPPKNRSRYLPTLTQVVEPAALEGAKPTMPALEGSESTGLDDFRVQEIVRTLMPTISVRLREISQTMLDERLQHLEANMLLELESMVRRVVNGCEVSRNLDHVEVAVLKM